MTVAEGGNYYKLVIYPTREIFSSAQKIWAEKSIYPGEMGLYGAKIAL